MIRSSDEEVLAFTIAMLKLINRVVNDALTQALPDKAAVGPVGRLLTVPEAAAYIGRSKRGIEALISKKILPTVRVGRSVRLDRLQLDKWIRTNTV